MKLKPRKEKEKDFNIKVHRHFAFPFPVRKTDGSGWWLEKYYSADILNVPQFIGTKSECEILASTLNPLRETDIFEYIRIHSKKTNCSIYSHAANETFYIMFCVGVVAFVFVALTALIL